MDTDKYRSVAINIEVIELIQLLAAEDRRSIPRTIEYLAKSELKIRLDKIKEKKNNLS